MKYLKIIGNVFLQLVQLKKKVAKLGLLKKVETHFWELKIVKFFFDFANFFFSVEILHIKFRLYSCNIS